jgi:hypothetical protein
MFRFTIRDVLRLMVVVGLGVGWWLDHRRQALIAIMHERPARIIFTVNLRQETLTAVAP